MYRLLKIVRHKLLERKKTRYIEELTLRGLILGRGVQIAGDFFIDPSHCYLISIGDNCTLSPNVRLIAHDASTKGLLGFTKIGKIEIRKNCYIGDSAIVLPGVTIGPNSIVGAGAVVTKSVPPDVIVVGNPATIVSSVREYAEKIRRLQRDKPVFREDYFIEKLDAKKRSEIIKSVGDSIGFIV